MDLVKAKLDFKRLFHQPYLCDTRQLEDVEHDLQCVLLCFVRVTVLLACSKKDSSLGAMIDETLNVEVQQLNEET